jgi:hypothetical protein
MAHVMQTATPAILDSSVFRCTFPAFCEEIANRARRLTCKAFPNCDNALASKENWPMPLSEPSGSLTAPANQLLYPYSLQADSISPAAKLHPAFGSRIAG